MSKLLSVLYCALGAVLLISSYCHAYEVPKPTGPYNAGVRRFIQPFFKNHSRNRNHVLMDATYEYMVTVYYPTLKESTVQPYLEPGFTQVLERDIEKLPQGILQQMMAHRVWNASFLPVKDPVGPTILFDGRLRFPPSDGHTILLSELASHGYTVAAIDHPFEQLYLKYPNGTEAMNPEGMKYGEYLLRTAYFDAALRRGNVTKDLLDRWPEIVDRMGAPFAKDNVGLLGFELGASSMIDVCNHTRVGAVAALSLQEPWGHMSWRNHWRTGWLTKSYWMKKFMGRRYKKIDTGTLPWGAERRVPALHLGGLRDHGRFIWMRETFPHAWWRWIVVRNAEFLDFTDWTIWKVLGPKKLRSYEIHAKNARRERARALGKINGERMVEIVNHVVKAFFDRHLRGDVPHDPVFEEHMVGFPELEILRGSHQTKHLGKWRPFGR